MINIMSRHGRAKLVTPEPELGKQALETLEEFNSVEQKEEQVLTELDNEIECPRCNKIMELVIPSSMNCCTPARVVASC